MQIQKLDDLLTLVERRIDSARSRVSGFQEAMNTNDEVMKRAEQRACELNREQRTQLLASSQGQAVNGELFSASDLNLSRVQFLKCLEARQRDEQQRAFVAREEARENKRKALVEMTTASNRKDLYHDLRNDVVKQTNNLQQNLEDEATSEIFMSRLSRNQ
ncbi:MAG: hypothetical protein ACRDAM_03555 [Casimicrobium sp.]